MNDEQLHPLIAAWLDGRITEENSAALQDMLRTSAAARSEFRRWTQLDAALREQVDQSAEAALPKNVVPLPAPAVRFRMLGWMAAAASFIALLSLSALWLHDRQHTTARSLTSQAPEQTNTGCAILTRSTDAEFADTKGLRVGDTIRPGALRLTRGVAQIEFFSGASMILEAGASLELVSPWEAVCHTGKVTVRVPPPAQGFKLRTAGMDLVDLGTEFGVNADAGGATEVHVFEGKVEAHPENAAMQLLSTGQSLRRAEDHTLSPGNTRPEDFPSIEKLNAISSTHAKERYDSWWQHMQKAKTDPRLLACYLFRHGPDDRWDRLVENVAEPRVPSRSGGAVGVRWTEGRWPMKDALEFKSPGDRVRVNLGKDIYSAITLAAWVRVDGLDRKYNALLLTDGYDPGNPHWQIYEDGRLMFSIAYLAPADQRVNKKNNQIYFSPRVFDLTNQRRWHHVAVTYDNQSGEAVQYLDGQEISREVSPMHQPGRPIQFGPCEIGNWGLPTQGHQFPIRNFNGRIDEFLIYQAALSPTEIHELFEIGKPE
ncbi:putative transmembrane anti-sigma factor [Chthoniobacter flavus Ellin428]|uniref:Putative transmembrane anti-sigma factor n=1 Tax=Chthoniobacter flavus Ellin428 TaxID=497964 RepID=B4CZ59_9BACT|nr:LamG-like jellyroll fold domain-containing protein [Chthoniobacter flavus]EDY20750.1 putative transmembrane anti-sigma factor [Chthoniobacter flavus Ellin428]TCO89645.1 FecR family protein [Chthoniobacter flavus]